MDAVEVAEPGVRGARGLGDGGAARVLVEARRVGLGLGDVTDDLIGPREPAAVERISNGREGEGLVLVFGAEVALFVACLGYPAQNLPQFEADFCEVGFLLAVADGVEQGAAV